MRLSRVRQSALIKRLLLLVPAVIIVCLCGSLNLYGQSPLATDDLLSVTFPNEKEGWTCGRSGAMLHTADGGKTWSRQASGTENTLASVHFR